MPDSDVPAAVPDAAAAKLVADLRSRATALGFQSLHVTTPDRVPDQADRLRAWLDLGYHGDMGWMAETAARRGHPAQLWPAAKSIIVLATNYAPAADPRDDLADRGGGLIAAYARRRDYHEVIKGRLKELAGLLVRRTGADVKVFVDTAPLMERPVAQAAGLGWQGKHTVLVSRSAGNWLLLGFLFTTQALPPDDPETDHCGRCTRCIAICPTQAITAPYRLDARRCIAYLTIEHAGPVPVEFRAAIGNRIFGCDDCLAVCPWNKFAARSHDQRMAARADLHMRRLADLVALDDQAFRRLFAGTPVKRTGRDRFVRNVLIAIGNSGDATLAVHAANRLGDAAPLVRGMAVWALHRLLPQRLQEHRALAASERDAQVLAEWRRAGIDDAA